MRKFIYTLIISVSFSALKAQPTLTYASNGPQPGQSFTIYEATTAPASPGNAGANQTWDFSSVPIGGANGSVSWVDPSGTPYGGDFPAADIALNSLGIYAYFTSNSSGFSQIGLEGTNQKGIFTAPQQQGAFPFTYQNSFGGNFAVTITITGEVDYRTGTETVIADAYGSLKTPQATYPSVLREKLYEIQIDSIIVGDFTDIIQINQASYLYFAPGDSYPIMDVSYDTTFGVGPSASCVFAVPGTTGINPVSLFQQNLHLFPNPADRRTTLQVSSLQADNITLSICNALGGTVKTLQTAHLSVGKNEIPIDLGGLAGGEYLLMVKSDKEGPGTMRFTVY